ncbi:hypothetical protein OUZ56_003032 [Daphnia magna]|uniref:Secreted protein n=1 Tax=Daphnia magna TaxID=35525 RepID=A0ABR0A7J3_9CRUS|nr:hypothetical protein OUZ56_003032 [Daphnia magna]
MIPTEKGVTVILIQVFCFVTREHGVSNIILFSPNVIKLKFAIKSEIVTTSWCVRRDSLVFSLSNRQPQDGVTVPFTVALRTFPHNNNNKWASFSSFFTGPMPRGSRL